MCFVWRRWNDEKLKYFIFSAQNSASMFRVLSNIHDGVECRQFSLVFALLKFDYTEIYQTWDVWVWEVRNGKIGVKFSNPVHRYRSATKTQNTLIFHRIIVAEWTWKIWNFIFLVVSSFLPLIDQFEDIWYSKKVQLILTRQSCRQLSSSSPVICLSCHCGRFCYHHERSTHFH